jgi:putative membrane protein
MKAVLERRLGIGAMTTIPYCGIPPSPAALLGRWNGDPILILILLLMAGLHLSASPGPARLRVLLGWIVAALALLSPLCALSVSLFCARVAQHMILVLLAAPLIGGALPRGRWRGSIWWSVAAFAVALWLWHMPAPYDATFRSHAAYWAMHVTLFGSAIWLWRDLLGHAPERALQALAAGTMASVQMGLLGAIIALAGRPLFLWHLPFTQDWGLTPLADQQLGGVIMWVPGCLLFLWAAMRSMAVLWTALERPTTR